METKERQETVHGHEVMEMMVESGQRYSEASLVDEMAERFGEEASYHTCCAEGLGASELIEFLWTKGKLTGTRDSFVFDPMDQCHGH